VPDQVKSTYKLPKPTDAVWQAIAQLYNKERSQLPVPGAECSPATLEKWMQDCVKAIRLYLYPALTSINAPRAGQDSGELIDTLAEDQHNSLLADLIAEEEQQVRQHQQTQVNQILSAALATLDPQVQQLLELYYAEGLTQQEMAKRLDMKQYTISRRFSKAREALLRSLAQWSQETLHVVPTSDVLNHMSTVLDEWLATYHRSSALPPQ
jgi:RNA polymerase sigma factor (sigma-70 family)